MSTIKISQKNKKLLEKKGINEDEIQSQINKFIKGFPYSKIEKPATLNAGIIDIDADKVHKYINCYEKNFSEVDAIKMVPASGAATRMFKKLYNFIEEYKGSDVDYATYMTDRSFHSIYTFFEQLENFAFYNDLKQIFFKNQVDNIEKIRNTNEFDKIIKALLINKTGMQYGSLPKALIKFHKYKGFERTSAEEHLVEGALYCKNKENVSKIHFTVSKEHQELLDKHLAKVKPFIEKEYGVKFEISYSVQKESTDTIAVTPDNKPVFNEDSTFVFRPGGHGALIENLNDLKEELVFIKNIDNVVPDRAKDVVVDYKKIIAGVLFDKKESIFNYLRLIDEKKADLKEIEAFIEKELCLILPEEYHTKTETQKLTYLHNKLNRPIRVCGMVKNEGEPGGGPFFVKQKDNTVSLQIVESVEINQEDETSKKIMDNSSHFNPVDLVCFTHDYKGKKFNLKEFVDPDTGFISNKSVNGKEIKALEHPGLWNGAMANWNTFFVEVPIETFAPVKTVWDLLRSEHQNFLT